MSLLVWEQRSLSSQRRPVWRWGLVWCVAQECEEGKPQGRSRSWERVGVTTCSCSPEGVKLQVRISNRMMGVGVAKRLRLSSSGVLETVPEKRLMKEVASGEEKQDRNEEGATAKRADLEEITMCLSLGVTEGFPPSPSLSSPRGRYIVTMPPPGRTGLSRSST